MKKILTILIISLMFVSAKAQTDEVADSDASLCWEQAGNRLTAMRGLLVYFTRCRPERSELQIAAAQEELDHFLQERIYC